MESTLGVVGILLAGILVVVGGVLFLRLHAFLALLLGALLVAALTPAASVERHGMHKDAVRVLAVDAGSAVLDTTPENGAHSGALYLLVRRSPETGRYERVGELQVQGVTEGPGGVGPRALATFGAATPTPQPGDLVVAPAAFRAAQALASQNVAQRVATGFGTTCANIGILIALASIVGMCLLKSGAADRIVRSALGVTGERGAPGAFLGSGFLLGIPVFFDTVFYLLIPLGKAMQVRTGRNYLLYVLAIVAGGAMAHTLVPPTPGPLLVAEQLGVGVGQMILGGLVVAAFASAAGYAFAATVNRHWKIPLRESPDFSLKDLDALAQRRDEDLPPLWLALLPIVLPVLLIGGYTVVQVSGVALPGAAAPWAATVGDKNIALLIAAAIALGTVAWKQRASRAELAADVQAALAGGGVIILITAAGGAFGTVLQQTGVAGLISELPRMSPVMLLSMAFLVASAIRTAQGSATVAMITAAGIFAGVAQADIGFHPLYLALAVGCGALPIGWMNDSGFWVITKMSGMTEVEGLKFVTPMLALQGVVGFLVVLLAATFFPMA